MPKSFQDIYEMLKTRKKPTIAVVAAEEKDVIQSLAEASKKGLIDAVLVGDARKIEEILNARGDNLNFSILDVPEEEKAAAAAVGLIKEGKADILMKGLINSSTFLHEVLIAEKDVTKKRVFSHMAAIELPGWEKLIYVSDGGMVIAPDLVMKQHILENALTFLRSMGIEAPKIAALTANEQINPKMPATTDAAKLAEMAKEGVFGPCVMEGPIAMDVALSKNAAKKKGIVSEISGDVDFFLVPNIEAGNILVKTLVHCANAQMAGVVLGASFPIVMTSRAESAEGKLNSIALACLGASGGKE